MSVLRKISGVTRRDRVRNLDILKDLAIEKDIIDILQIRGLTYFGHIIRMAHGYIHGQRPRGRPRKKWMDNIREDCAQMDMSLIQASRLSWDRARWRNTIRNKGEDYIVLVAWALSQVSEYETCNRRVRLKPQLISA